MKNRTYRYFKGDVQYPFGYGRTYTKFSLKNIELNGMTLRAEVENIGDFESDTVLQLYLTCPTADFGNPIKSLISFKRISLHPQEAVNVEFKIENDQLLSVNDLGEKVLLSGEHKLVLTDGCDFSSDPICFQVK